MLRMIILSHNMACHDLDTFIDQELGTIGLRGCSPVPSARTGAAGLFCRLQGGFGIGMGNPLVGVFGLSYRPTRHKTRLIVLAPTKRNQVPQLSAGQRKWSHGCSWLQR